MFYSVIVPVYNRPDEIKALLECLTKQVYKSFEVCVVESGSEIKSEVVVNGFKDCLSIQYILTGNNGQGFSRNTGFKHAKGDYFIILDSDVLLENDFIKNIDTEVQSQHLDAYGGPDRCHESFSDIEKAINYSLTSFITTGGMRGNKKSATTFYPRSFNMGFSRKVYEATGGYKLPFMGEDIELSHRIIKLGFKSGLIPEAFVYHHRKKSLKAFFKQMQFFGKARLNILKHVPGSLKLIHLIPLGFLLYLIVSQSSLVLGLGWYVFFNVPLLLFFLIILLDSTRRNHSIKIGILSVGAAFIQLMGYACGLVSYFMEHTILKGNKGLKNI